MSEAIELPTEQWPSHDQKIYKKNDLSPFHVKLEACTTKQDLTLKR